jgi:hypothetical protein
MGTQQQYNHWPTPEKITEQHEKIINCFHNRLVYACKVTNFFVILQAKWQIDHGERTNGTHLEGATHAGV